MHFYIYCVNLSQAMNFFATWNRSRVLHWNMRSMRWCQIIAEITAGENGTRHSMAEVDLSLIGKVCDTELKFKSPTGSIFV